MAVSWNDADGTYRLCGGFSDAALHLTLLNKRMVSRQLVYRWWTKRAANGFPDFETVTALGTAGEMLDLNKVAAWYATYVPAKGGRPPGRQKGRDQVNVA